MEREVSSPAGIDIRHLVGGSWRDGSGDEVTVFDPYSGAPLVGFAAAGAAISEEAVDHAERARTEWRRVPPKGRGDALRGIARVIREYRPHLATCISSEMGKPVGQAEAEVDFAAEFLEYNAQWDRLLTGDILRGDNPDESIVLDRVPMGVVAAVCPWNFPLAVAFRKIAPALVTGNTVVVKPSEVAPIAVTEAIRLALDHVSLPAGVLSVVNGGPAEGEALVANPGVNMVSFTGHRDTGKAVMARASQNLTRVALELGGKAPAIVFPDADLSHAVSAIVEARHTNAGQVCTAAERVFVHGDVHDEFVDRYVRAVSGLRVGRSADVGPLASATQLEKAHAALQRVEMEGATLVSSDFRADDADSGGYWFAPVVATDVSLDMSVMNDEVFCPITPIARFESSEEVLEGANRSRYGLSAYVFSNDFASVHQAVDRLEFGEVYVNRSLGESVQAHHAGFKESGMGGEDGYWGLLKYTQVKTVYYNYASR